jgi:hypothetical protein
MARDMCGQECMQSTSNAYTIPNRTFKKIIHFKDVKF